MSALGQKLTSRLPPAMSASCQQRKSGAAAPNGRFVRNLETTLRRLIAEHGVDPSRFVLEITEGVLLEATEHTNLILDALRSLGFRTALDDFGTGYSSLAYLCNFKFDKIKIDRSFVGRISRVDISRTIVQSVVRIGRGLGWASLPRASRRSLKQG